MEEQLKIIIINKYGSIRQFSQKINIPYTTVDSILKRGIDNSNVVNVIKICKELNISTEKLINEHIIMNNLNFDNATPVDMDQDTVQIPVFGIIKAGLPIEAQEDILEYIDIPKSWTRGGKRFYGLKISSNSMFPKYSENDIVIFEQTDDYSVENGKDCTVMVNGYDATFKNVTIGENGITLVPFNLSNNDNYQPTFYSKEQISELPVKIIGIAREKRTRL